MPTPRSWQINIENGCFRNCVMISLRRRQVPSGESVQDFKPGIVLVEAIVLFVIMVVDVTEMKLLLVTAAA